MSDYKQKDSPSKGSQKKDIDDDSSNKNLSISKILEGMTTEFNKTSPKKNAESPTRRSSRIEPAIRKQEKIQNKKTSPDSSLVSKQKVSNNVEQPKILKEAVERIAEKKKPEDEVVLSNLSKKDGNIPGRIVLTFRTIDEKTDRGKKTKISSCDSTLSVVTDDLSNCEQISGVSVKIENFEDCDGTNKSSSESKKIQNEIFKEKASTTNGSSKVQNGERTDAMKEKFFKDMNLTSIVDKMDDDNDTVGDESSKDSSHETISSDKKGRQKRKKESR